MRRLEHTGEGHNKFWEVYDEGKTVNVRYGPIGKAGTILTKRFTRDSDAADYVYNKVLEKKREGYVEQHNPSRSYTESLLRQIESFRNEVTRADERSRWALDKYRQMKQVFESR